MDSPKQLAVPVPAPPALARYVALGPAEAEEGLDAPRTQPSSGGGLDWKRAYFT